MSPMLNELALIISVLVGVSTLIGAWLKIKQSEAQRAEAELRLKDVFDWSNDVIATLAALRMCILKSLYQDQAADAQKVSQSIRTDLEKIALDSSILIDRGRLFFRNPDADHAQGKVGKRPRILDWIVLANRIAIRIAGGRADATGEERIRLFILADRCAREFVHFAQQEVGRQRAVSPDAAGMGDEMDVDEWLSKVEVDHAAKRLNEYLSSQSKQEPAKQELRVAPLQTAE